MRFPRACALVSLLLLALSLGASTAAAQRLAPAGVRPLAPPSLRATAGPAADARGIHRGSGSAVLLTPPAPTNDAWLASAAYDRLALERNEPSLWKHLMVGVLAGATLGFAASSVAYGLSCEDEGEACAFAGLGVIVSTGLGAGAGLLAGGAVYVWKRTRH